MSKIKTLLDNEETVTCLCGYTDRESEMTKTDEFTYICNTCCDLWQEEHERRIDDRDNR